MQQYNSEAIFSYSAPTPEAFYYLCGFVITIVPLPTEDPQPPSEKVIYNSTFSFLAP